MRNLISEEKYTNKNIRLHCLYKMFKTFNVKKLN